MDGASWIAEKLTEANGKSRAKAVDQDVVFVEREDMPDEYVGVVPIPKGGPAFVTKKMVESLVAKENRIAFVVSIPRVARWSGSAMNWLASKNIAFGGVGDLFSASNDEEMRNHRNKERAFVEDGIRGHSRVVDFEWDEDRLARVRLSSGLSVTIALCNEYDVTIAAARDSKKALGTFDVLLKTNPNGSVTVGGKDEIDALGFEVLKWGELLSYLARRGGSARSGDLRKRLEVLRSR